MKKEIIEKIYESKKNLIIDGDVSSGKTKDIMFPIVEELIKKDENLVIIDSKEEYLKSFYDDLKNKEYNIRILNFRNLDASEKWNPLTYPYNLYKAGDKDSSMEQLNYLAKTIFYEETTNDPFWTNTASDFFTGCALGLFRDAKKEEVNFKSIATMFEETGKKYGSSTYLTEYFNLKKETDPAYICASSTIKAPNETKGGILAVSRQRINIYSAREKLSKLMSESSFNYNELNDNKTALFIIGREDNTFYNNLVNILIEQIFKSVYNADLGKCQNIIIDSLDYLNKIHEFENILNASLPKTIKFYMTTRDFDSINAKYDFCFNKLCNLIKINKDIMTITCNSNEEENKIERIKLNKECQVDYPELNLDDVKTFDFEGFIEERKKNSLINDSSKKRIPSFEEFMASRKNTKRDSEIDELIKKIDTKLAKMEEEERNDERARNIKHFTEKYPSLTTDEVESLVQELQERIDKAVSFYTKRDN